MHYGVAFYVKFESYSLIKAEISFQFKKKFTWKENDAKLWEIGGRPR